MSDGLFQQDPPYEAETDRHEAPHKPSTVDDRGKDTSAGKQEQPSDSEADNALVPASTVSVCASQVGAELSQSIQPNEALPLDGLTQEQPAHHPATVPISSSEEPVTQEYVSPSETEAPLPFRLFARVYSAVTGPTAIALAVAFGGVLVLYIYLQVLSLLGTLATLPTWLATTAVVFLGFLMAVVILAFGRLAATYIRLRWNNQIRSSDIQQLERHAQIRRGCSPSRQRLQAKAVLEAYVREYPQYAMERAARHQPYPANASSAAQPRPPQTSLFSVEDLTQLYRTQRRLADPVRTKDSKEWLSVYASEFQSVLDAAARERVSQCAKWVGFKTAISPNSLVDTLIAAYWCFVMLRDLCVIYNVRVGFYGTAALLWRCFFTAYLAGKFQDWEPYADETIESMMSGLGLPEIGQKIVGKVAAKSATGLANYFMVKRLGTRAIQLLAPLTIDSA